MRKGEQILRGVVTFSEWAKEISPKEPVLEGRSASPLLRKTWTVEVPFEKPKGYVEQPKTLAEHIRKKWILLGLTQKVLAEPLKVRECSVYNWERGIRPRTGSLGRIVEFLGYSPVLERKAEVIRETDA